MGSGYQVLTTEQAEHFLERGFVVIHEGFSPEAAAELTDSIWTRLGYDPDDRSTWADPSVHMPGHRRMDVREFAPRVWGAACDLLGGEERIAKPYVWGDGFIVNLWQGADEPWVHASPQAQGWHKDGDFFRHFLDSPEQGLLTLVLWSDVRHQGGATFVACDSIGPVARFLAARPEGVLPGEFDIASLVGQCTDFAEATGRVADVYLLHPYILHAKAQNLLRVPRFITNPPIHLAEPMRFDRPDPADLSLVERAVLRGLGVDRCEFVPAAPRERVVPERVRRQERMKAEELARLAGPEEPVRRRPSWVDTDTTGGALCNHGQVPWVSQEEPPPHGAPSSLPASAATRVPARLSFPFVGEVRGRVRGAPRGRQSDRDVIPLRGHRAGLPA